MWLVALETDDGMWNDDPVAAHTKDEAVRIARERWSKPDQGETLILYQCFAEAEITTNQPMTGQLAGA